MRFCPERLMRGDDLLGALADNPDLLEICHSNKALDLVPVLRQAAPRTLMVGVVGHAGDLDLMAPETSSLFSCHDLIGCVARELARMAQHRHYDALGGLGPLERQMRLVYRDRFEDGHWMHSLAPVLAGLRDRPLPLLDDGLSPAIKRLALRLATPVLGG